MIKAVGGPCLPGLSLEQQLLKDYYEERFARGFEYAFVVPGMTRVVQAAGRLIRSARDTGIIALFDRRFLYSPDRSATLRLLAQRLDERSATLRALAQRLEPSPRSLRHPSQHLRGWPPAVRSSRARRW